MALPNSGPISLQDIEDEFGGTGSISISEYYGAASGVPASGTISISDFYGTSAGFAPVSFGYWMGGAGPPGTARNTIIRRIQYSNDTISVRPATLPTGTSHGVALQDTTNAFIVEGYNGPTASYPPVGANIMKFQFSNETTSNPPATFEVPGPFFGSPTNRTIDSFAVSSKDNGYKTGGKPGTSNIYTDELSKLVFSTETTSVSPSSTKLLPIPRSAGQSFATISTGFLVGGEPQPPTSSVPSNPGVTKFTYSTETYSNVSGAPAIGTIRYDAAEFIDRDNDFGYVCGGRVIGVPFGYVFDIEKINLTNDTQSDLGDFGPPLFPPSRNLRQSGPNFSPSAGYVFDNNDVHKFPYANETFNASSPPSPVIPAFPGIPPFYPLAPSPFANALPVSTQV